MSAFSPKSASVASTEMTLTPSSALSNTVAEYCRCLNTGGSSLVSRMIMVARTNVEEFRGGVPWSKAITVKEKKSSSSLLNCLVVKIWPLLSMIKGAPSSTILYDTVPFSPKSPSVA